MEPSEQNRWQKTMFDIAQRRFPELQPVRHGVKWIPTSTIAQQYYCELKVEHEYLLGEVETESKRAGEELHEALIQTTTTTVSTLIRDIERQPFLGASFPLFATVNDVGIAGIPDLVLFEKSRPVWVIELKTTRGDPMRLFEDQEVQVRIYGLLLDKMGFDCGKLKLAVVRLQVSQSAPGRAETLNLIIEGLLTNRVDALERHFKGIMKVHVLSHDLQAALKSVERTLGYWQKDRNPTSTTVVGRCRACEFNKTCPASLYKPMTALESSH